MPAGWNARIALLGLTLAAFACSKSDEICKTWEFSHGVVATFNCNGELEIFDHQGNSRGTAKWARDGEHIDIDGPAQPILGNENRYLVHKLGDNQLILKGTRSSDLLSAVLKNK